MIPYRAADHPRIPEFQQETGTHGAAPLLSAFSIADHDMYKML
jgi:hypothetical protein